MVDTAIHPKASAKLAQANGEIVRGNIDKDEIEVLRKTREWICTIGRENLAFEDLQELTHFLDVIEAVWQTFVFELGCSDSNEVIDYFINMPLQLATTMIAHNYTVSIELYFTLREAMIQWSFSRMHHQHGQVLVNMSTVSKQCQLL